MIKGDIVAITSDRYKTFKVPRGTIGRLVDWSDEWFVELAKVDVGFDHDGCESPLILVFPRDLKMIRDVTTYE